MTTFKITLAYDGTDYVGWQRQPSGVSIQGLLEDALREFDDHAVAVAGAGRTDAGVHALGQVASFALERDLEPATLVRALNHKLPPDLRVRRAEHAPDGFHARFDARAKTYRYRIWNGDVLSPFQRRYAWHLVGALDVDAMKEAARLVEGTHDFAAFQGQGSDAHKTVRRVIRSQIVNAGSRIDLEICGEGFLRHMVRTIAGSLVEVGRRRRSPVWVGDVIRSRDRTQAGQTAPALGVFLVSVSYGAVLAAEP